jgi:hypothetical protein
MREEVTDRYGNVIYLADERWKHIVAGHGKLNGHRAEILKKFCRRAAGRSSDNFKAKIYIDKGNRPDGELLPLFNSMQQLSA